MSFAGVESAIIARLDAKIRAPKIVRAVLSSADLAGIQEQGQPTPALHVLLARYRVADGTTDGTRVLMEQTWWIVASVSNALAGRGAGTATAKAREDAGVILDAVAPALMGWRPPVDGCSPLRMIDPPQPEVGERFAYYPLAFAVESVINGAIA